ncbi:hypothetical protein D3C81_1980210 [compost metagenome]
MLSIASDRVADHFTQRGLIVPLEFELDALGTLGMCWRKGTESDQGIADLLDSLRYASANQIEFPDAR